MSQRIIGVGSVAPNGTEPSTDIAQCNESKGTMMTQKFVESELMKAGKHLAAYRAAGEITEIDLALSEKDADKILIRQAKQNMSNTISSGGPSNEAGSELWCTNFTQVDLSIAVWGSTLLGMITPMSIMMCFGIFLADAAILSISGLFIALFLSLSMGENGSHPYPTIRNKVIFRKKYKRELRRLVERNRENAARYQKMLQNRDKKLAKAQKIVANLAQEHEKNNPGKTLVIHQGDGMVMEIPKWTRPRRIPLAQKILNGSE